MYFKPRVALFRNMLCSLSSLLLIFFIVQVIVNHKKEENSISADFTISSKVEKMYRKYYNLIDGPGKEVGEECTLDYINENKLEQDHPCVIKIIRTMYLSPPSPANVPYNLTNTFDGYVPAAIDESEALLLKNKKAGFFVECGAFDGFFISNTLQIELNFKNWTGLLIEASPLTYKRLLARNRKAWTSNVCLSLNPYPTRMDFTTSENPMATYRVIETDEKGNKLYNHDSDIRFGLTKLKTVKIQCCPFYSLLLALNQTTIDYFSLDIEGHEKRILETIPWNKMVIKVMRIETSHIPSEQTNKTGSDALKEFLEGEPGYFRLKKDKEDEIYIKNPIN